MYARGLGAAVNPVEDPVLSNMWTAIEDAYAYALMKNPPAPSAPVLPTDWTTASTWTVDQSAQEVAEQVSNTAAATSQQLSEFFGQQATDDEAAAQIGNPVSSILPSLSFSSGLGLTSLALLGAGALALYVTVKALK